MKATMLKKRDCINIKDLTDPIVLKRVIDTLLDPKNPDSNKIRKEVIKNISHIIKKDDAFITTIKGLVVDKAEDVTNDIVKETIEESKEYLTNALVNTINFQAQDYFDDKRKFVDNVLKKTINDCIRDILTETKKVIEKGNKKLKDNISDKKSTTIDVPLEHLSEVRNYVQFLSSQKQTK